MRTLITENTSEQDAAEASEATCQTDSRPKAGNYVLSRLNACVWQTRRDAVMACLGPECRYRFCGYADGEMPPRGTACPWEVAYAALVVDQFDDLFPSDGIGRHLDDRLHWRREWTIAHLVANRASVRATLALQQCWKAITDRGRLPVDTAPFAEYDLSRRYQAAARNRISALWDQLPAIEERVREHRIGLLMVFHGYHHGLGKGPTPPLTEVPQWIVSAVDDR